MENGTLLSCFKILQDWTKKQLDKRDAKETSRTMKSYLRQFNMVYLSKRGMP
jgi:hypothetical protein